MGIFVAGRACVSATAVAPFDFCWTQIPAFVMEEAVPA